jgi:hypothetical protein
MRQLLTDSYIYMATIGTQQGERATSAEENGFFDNFELIK